MLHFGNFREAKDFLAGPTLMFGISHPCLFDYFRGRIDGSKGIGKEHAASYIADMQYRRKDYISLVQVETDCMQKRINQKIEKVKKQIHEVTPTRKVPFSELKDEEARRSVRRNEKLLDDYNKELNILIQQQETLKSLFLNHQERAEAAMQRHIREYWKGFREGAKATGDVLERDVPKELLESTTAGFTWDKSAPTYEKKEEENLQWKKA